MEEPGWRPSHLRLHLVQDPALPGARFHVARRGVAQNSRARVTQVLVPVSIYQGVIYVLLLEPQPKLNQGSQLHAVPQMQGTELSSNPVSRTSNPPQTAATLGPNSKSRYSNETQTA